MLLTPSCWMTAFAHAYRTTLNVLSGLNEKGGNQATIDVINAN